MKKSILSLLLILIFTIIFNGCTIKREVIPTKGIDSTNICIIKNERVKGHFLENYVDSLEELRFVVNVLPPNSQLNSCEIISTYTARRSWEITTYLSYAKIKVYKNSKFVGNAVYDARGGKGMVFDVHIDEKAMVKSLVAELFQK